MKKISLFFIIVFLNFPLIAQKALVGVSKDQFKSYSKFHQEMVKQAFLTETQLFIAFKTWAAVGLYAPPTIQAGFERKAEEET